jgi:hypothetical protein
MVRRTLVGRARPQAGELDHRRPVVLLLDARERAVLPRAGVGAQELGVLDDLAVHDLDDAVGRVRERDTEGDLGRVRVDGADAGEGDAGGGVEERGKVEVEGEVEEEEVDAEVEEAGAFEL